MSKMIGKLIGIVDSIYNDHLVINVNNVGYIVFCSTNMLSNVSQGEHITLFIETQVRQDAIKLYGFGTSEEKNIFNILTLVKGVGAKAGLAILSHIPVEDIHNALVQENIKLFYDVPGIGKKTAERIINELKHQQSLTHNMTFNLQSDNISLAMINDAITALTQLGMSKNEAEQKISPIIKTKKQISLDDLIRLALSNK